MSDTPPVPAWLHQHQSDDLDLHSQQQHGWALQYAQMSPGQFHGQLQQVFLPHMTLLREDCNLALHQRGHLAPDVYGFATPLHDDKALYFNGRPVPPHAIMCGKGDEVDLHTPPSLALLAIVVQRDLLNPLWERMYQSPLATWLEKQLVLVSTAAKIESVRSTQLATLDFCFRNPQLHHDEQAMLQLRDDILIEWIEALPPQVDLSDVDSLRRKKRLVDKACEVMLAQSDEPLSILEICQRVGTSRRTLNSCFQEVLGTTPVKYLRALRLNGVRRALRQAQAQDTIQHIAARWGFWHLSQFAADYKKLFGELPSATLAHKKTGAAP